MPLGRVGPGMPQPAASCLFRQGPGGDGDCVQDGSTQRSPVAACTGRLLTCTVHLGMRGGPASLTSSRGTRKPLVCSPQPTLGGGGGGMVVKKWQELLWLLRTCSAGLRAESALGAGRPLEGSDLRVTWAGARV